MENKRVIFFIYLGIGEEEENCKALSFLIPAKKKFGCGVNKHGHYFSNWLYVNCFGQ